MFDRLFDRFFGSILLDPTAEERDAELREEGEDDKEEAARSERTSGSAEHVSPTDAPCTHSR